MNFSYSGRTIYVNLSEGAIVKKQHLDLVRNYLGGRGINIRILYDLLKPHTDPYGAENLIIFGVGSLVGTLTPGACRGRVASISPLTGILGDSSVGGHWCPELRFAGYDHIVITGRSEKPVYLWIKDELCEIRSADHVWGKDVLDTDKTLRQEVGDEDAEILCIGPAGENLVRYACIACSVYDFAGRTGMGAVMGSKKLKAIAVRGTKGLGIFDAEAFRKILTDTFREMKSHPRFQRLSNQGVIGAMDGIVTEMQPVRNFQAATFEEAEQLKPNIFFDKYMVKRKTCFSCPIGCLYHYLVTDDGLECYGQGFPDNPLIEFGYKLGLDSYAKVLNLYTIANRYGLDVDSVASTIAFAIECFQRGILTGEQYGCANLEWGDFEVMSKLIRDIVYRQGVLGNLLADGTRRAANRIGKGSDEYAIHVKGLELLTELRNLHGSSLAHAVSSRGGCHTRTQCFVGEAEFLGGSGKEWAEKMFGQGIGDITSINGKARFVKYFEDLLAVADSLGVCAFIVEGMPIVNLGTVSRFLHAVTGETFDTTELLICGERINNLERLFNIREGIGRDNDTLPKRLLKEPMVGGLFNGWYVKEAELSKMLDEYYSLRGWDINTGVPSEGKLKELCLK
jgi:aldehyde:ferredoxin oxidoreductase